jgi:hypothetical protein
MAEINVIGKVKFVGETVDVGASGFQKRELVVTTDEQYPQHILINFVQDKCNLLANYKVGDNVNVSVNLRGREWINPQGEAKYFNDIQGWKIANIQPAYNAAPPAAAPPVNQAQNLPTNQAVTEFDDSDILF